MSNLLQEIEAQIAGVKTSVMRQNVGTVREIGAIILGDYTGIKEGQEVKTTGKLLQVPVGRGLLGRVVNTLGQPVDGKGPVKSDVAYPVEKIAPGIIKRKSVTQPVQTGIMAVDAMIPIGRGQRELIIG